MTNPAPASFDLDETSDPNDSEPEVASSPEESKSRARKTRGPRPVPMPEPNRPPMDPPVHVVAAANGTADPEDMSAWPKDALQLWPKIIEWLASKGIGPDEVDISVKRMPIGPFKGEEVDLSIIKGRTVAGSAVVSPAEALQQYVIDVLHAAGGEGSKVGSGPAVYTLKFFYRRGGTTIKEGKLELASYQELLRARERAVQMDTRAEMLQEGQAPLPPLGPPHGFARAGAAASGPAPSPSAAAPPPPPPPPMPPGASPADVEAAIKRQQDHDRIVADLRVDLAIAKMQAEQTAQMAALRAEFAARQPVAPAINQQELAAQVTQAVMAGLVARGVVSADGTPVVAAAQGASKDSLAGLLEQLEQAERIKNRLRKIVGDDDDDRPTPATPQPIVVEKPRDDDDDEAWIAKAVKFVAKNPGVAQAVLQGAGTALEGSPAGAMLKKIADAAGVAAAAQTAAGSVPMPQQPPAGWKPPGA
jgi:hypothetical protein